MMDVGGICLGKGRVQRQTREGCLSQRDVPNFISSVSASGRIRTKDDIKFEVGILLKIRVGFLNRINPYLPLGHSGLILIALPYWEVATCRTARPSTMHKNENGNFKVANFTLKKKHEPIKQRAHAGGSE